MSVYFFMYVITYWAVKILRFSISVFFLIGKKINSIGTLWNQI